MAGVPGSSPRVSASPPGGCSGRASILLGFDLVFPDVLHLGAKALAVVVAVVALTYVGTLWAGRRLGVSENLTLLVAVGFSICGVSAIAAANGIVEADEDEVTFAVALVTLCGTLAIVVLPSLREPLGLSREAYGAWVGAGVHDVAQVVATSSTAGQRGARHGGRRQADARDAAGAAGRAARAAALALGPARAAAAHPRCPASSSSSSPRSGSRAPTSSPRRLTHRIDDVRTVLLGMALFALGSRVQIARLLRIGVRPLVLGLASWVLIAAVAYAGVRIAWA